MDVSVLYQTKIVSVWFCETFTIEIELLVMWCGNCCPWWKEDEPEQSSGLLASPKWQNNDVNKTEYYTVRRISSFGRAGSGDDVSDKDHGEGEVQSPAEFWTPKIQKVQPESSDGDYYGNTTDHPSPRSSSKPPLPRGRWRKALYPFKTKRDTTKNREQTDVIPPITVSSPDLIICQCDIIPQQQKDESHQQRLSPRLGPRLRHAGTVTNVSSITIEKPHTNWLKSQSMQDINVLVPEKENGCALSPENPEDSKKLAAADLARSYGLDTSLYTSNHVEGDPMSRSNEALNAWRTPDTTDKADWLQEASCGMLHFTASYYQKSKKLFVHINRAEGLPPKGEQYTYNVIVKLTILPFDKPVRMSKICKNELNPEIEEDFEFTVKDPLGKVLRLSLYDSDHQGKYDAVGHALFYLEDVIAGRPRRYSMKLYKRSQPDVTPGNIQVNLSYKKDTMLMSVVVLEACNLLLSSGTTKSNRLTDKYNTYVKLVYFSAGQKMKSKKSTSIFKNNRNPKYNQTFSVKLSSNFLHECYIVISVMMKGLLKKDVPIGRLKLGPFHYTEGRQMTPWGRAILLQQEVTHWFRMYL